MTGGFGNAPILMIGGCWAQPVVCVALQVAVLITATVPDGASSAAYRVWVASSIAPTLACGSAHRDRRDRGAAGQVPGVAGGAVDHVDLRLAEVAGVDGVGGRVGRHQVLAVRHGSALRRGSRWCWSALQRLMLVTDRMLAPPTFTTYAEPVRGISAKRVRERVVSGTLDRRGLLVRRPVAGSRMSPCRCRSGC